MLSNLSIVPPVNDSPRPLILPTGKPQAATIGPAANVVLSPTPPLECLSTITVPRGRLSCRSNWSPLAAMASVRSVVSRSVMPRK